MHMFTFKIWVYDDSNAAEPEYTLIGDTNSDGTMWHRLTRAGDPKAYDLNEYFPFGLSTALSAYGLRLTTSERERVERERLISDKSWHIREQIILLLQPSFISTLFLFLSHAETKLIKGLGHDLKLEAADDPSHRNSI